jgi:superfamily II DNA or RNA helicase
LELRPYQREAKEAILHEWEEKDKTLLVLPTGCGKTVVFADVAKSRTASGRVLVLAHREELLTQAADKIKSFCGLECSVEKAEQTAPRPPGAFALNTNKNYAPLLKERGVYAI